MSESGERSSEISEAAFAPATPGATPLFLDTSGLFAYFNPRVDRHTQARAFVRGIGSGRFPYRPLYTSTYVVDELVTLLSAKGTHGMATQAYEMLTSSEAIVLLREEREHFETAGERFLTFDDHDISLTDHLSAVQMDAEGIDHVFAYDADFAVLNRTVIPHSSSG